MCLEVSESVITYQSINHSYRAELHSPFNSIKKKNPNSPSFSGVGAFSQLFVQVLL